MIRRARRCAPCVPGSLFEWQIRHHGSARFDDHGTHRRKYILHGFKEEPRAHDLGSFLVLPRNGAEARGLTGCFRDARALVATRALHQLDGPGARLWQHLIGIALRFVDRAVAILFCTEHVVEGRAHGFGRLHVLQLDAENHESRFVVIECLLQRLLGLDLDDAALFGKHVVDRVATHHAADGRLRRIAQHRSRVGYAIARLERVLDPVLHDEREVHDVGVARLHRGFELVFFARLCAGANAELLAIERLHVHDFVILDRRREMPTQPRLRLGSEVLSKAQDHRRLTGLELVGPEVGPSAEHDQRDAEDGQVGDRPPHAASHLLLGRLQRFACHQPLFSILRAAASLAR